MVKTKCRTFVFPESYRLHTFLQVEGDGDCMMSSVLAEIKFASKGDRKRYKTVHLRRQVIHHVVENMEIFKPWLREQLQNFYGGNDESNDEEPGPFSIKSYLQYMAEPYNWGDAIFISLMASCMSCRITVLRSDNCREMAFRHKDKAMDEVDLVLIYNCDMFAGHYSAVHSVNDKQMILDKLKNSRGYRQKDDKSDDEPDDGDKGDKPDDDDDDGDADDGDLSGKLSQERLQDLLDKEKLFDDIGGLMGKAGYPTATPAKDSDDTDIELGEVEDVHVEKDQKNCTICNEDFPTTARLRRHLRRDHKNKAKYRCSQCNKGFQLMEGYRQHKFVHKPKEERIQCEKCPETFGLRKTYNTHMREQHHANKGQKKETCPLKCGFSTDFQRNVKQHMLHCKNNPNKKWYTCEICHEYKSTHKGKVKQHKIRDHGWSH